MSKILETETQGFGPAFAIHGFMRYLGLKPAQLVAYAIIYASTVERGRYDLGTAVLADWSGTTERTARTTIASLLEKGLVYEDGFHVHGLNTTGRALVASDSPVEAAIGAWKADHPEWNIAGPAASPANISPEKSSSPEISSREDSSSPEKISPEVFSPEISSPENISSPANISREKSSSREISSREDSSSPEKISREVFSPEVFSPENISSPANISREKSSSPEISSREDSSSPEKISGEAPYIPIRGKYPVDRMDGWIEIPSNQPSDPSRGNFQVDTEADFREIVNETVNRNRLIDARPVYDDLRKRGMEADEILTAWKRFQADAREAGRSDKYMPQLRKWLLDDSVKGCRRMVEASRSSGSRGERRLRQAPDGTWLVVGDGPVHPVVDGAGVAWKGDMEGALALARARNASS